jgi:hypothetical protein
MMVNGVASDRADLNHKWLVRLGGIAAMLLSLGYIAIIALYIPLGAPPSGAEGRLGYIAGNTTLWWAILGVSVLTDFLLVPVALALYTALKATYRSALLLASAFVALFIFLDLALTWTNYAVLITLGGSFAAAASEAQKAALVAAAQYPAAVLESNLVFVYNTLTLSLGILIYGIVMLQGVFSRIAAWLGVATGVLGILAVAGSFFASTAVVTIFASLLTTVWIFLVGWGLLRLSRA